MPLFIIVKIVGASEAFSLRRPLFLAAIIVGILITFILAIPATYHSAIFMDNPPGKEMVTLWPDVILIGC